mmetsp:Transcript_8611/g.13337  ORF Transcript_8611/g.13337 Transcript_8611/m.13337 type:complete len:119 (-) Transcript_8611:1640-1996(-)
MKLILISLRAHFLDTRFVLDPLLLHVADLGMVYLFAVVLPIIIFLAVLLLNVGRMCRVQPVLSDPPSAYDESVAIIDTPLMEIKPILVSILELEQPGLPDVVAERGLLLLLLLLLLVV